MSCQFLYVQGFTLSETEDDGVEEDVWDDTKLNAAYDKAVKIANAEVAKRIAMSTNSANPPQSNTEKGHTKEKKDTQQKGSPKNQPKKGNKWKAGMPCRAVYEADGQEYEAYLMRNINDTECVVRFIGYDNTEIVPISALKPSYGKVARAHQIQNAVGDSLHSGEPSELPVDVMDYSDAGTSTATERSRKKKPPKKNQNQKFPSGLNQMFDPAMLGNLNSMDMEMPLPPPPPIGFQVTENEDQAISSMLLSWYMSGYYTGLYQGMKKAKEKRRNSSN